MQHYLYGFLRLRVSIGLLLLIMLCPYASRANSGTVLVLGDSISAAYGMSLEQGWVSLLAEKLQKVHPEYRVINASISGETSAGGLRRLPQLLAEHIPSIVVVELGGNDGLRGYPIGKLREDLTNIVTLSQQNGARVLLLPMEIPPNYGSRYTGSFRDSFPVVAAETGSILGPFPLVDVATEPQLMQADGIHPTVAAQSILLDTIYPALVEML
ncbi:MAG: acyl-CoA thioesterase-1 [Alcanivorax sp.]|jgi:acyl-CoA thioesterase-1